MFILVLKKFPGENKVPSVVACNLPEEKVLLAKRAIGFGNRSKSFRFYFFAINQMTIISKAVFILQ